MLWWLELRSGNGGTFRRWSLVGGAQINWGHTLKGSGSPQSCELDKPLFYKVCQLLGLHHDNVVLSQDPETHGYVWLHEGAEPAWGPYKLMARFGPILVSIASELRTLLGPQRTPHSISSHLDSWF